MQKAEPVKEQEKKTRKKSPYKAVVFSKGDDKGINVYGESEEKILAKIQSWNRGRTDEMKLISCSISKLNTETNKYENPVMHVIEAQETTDKAQTKVQAKAQNKIQNKAQKTAVEAQKVQGNEEAQKDAKGTHGVFQKFNQGNVTDLVQILHSQKQDQDAELVRNLLTQMNEIIQRNNDILNENAKLREEVAQLNQIKSILGISTVAQQAADYREIIQNQNMQLQQLGNVMNDKAGSIVSHFKEVGARALDNVCGFLGVKEALVKMRDMARSNAEEIKTYIENVDSVRNEMENAAKHMQNIDSKIASGRRNDPAALGQYKVFKNIKSHYQKEMKFCEKRTQKLDNMINKHQKRLEHYEKRAGKLTGAIDKVVKIEQTANKPSIRAKLEENKAVLEAKEGAEPKQEREKPLQADLAL